MAKVATCCASRAPASQSYARAPKRGTTGRAAERLERRAPRGAPDHLGAVDLDREDGARRDDEAPDAHLSVAVRLAHVQREHEDVARSGRPSDPAHTSPSAPSQGRSLSSPCRTTSPVGDCVSACVSARASPRSRSGSRLRSARPTATRRAPRAPHATARRAWGFATWPPSCTAFATCASAIPARGASGAKGAS